MSKFQNDAIFWVDVDKIDPNPYQPRRDFNEESLRDLAESIRQYGVLQPLTVTRNEETKDDGGLKVYYELIAGERRLRAAKMANLSQVPVTIRDQKEDKEVKLELAIIENLQREDLNPIERAEAFNQLAEQFDFTHKEISEKIGKSREYVSNSMRLLKLPEKVKKAVIAGKITEGHTRPIMMLRDKPEKQEQLFKEIIHQDLTVRESEKRARRDAQDKVRSQENKVDPETKALEDELSDTLGTRVTIEKKDDEGGKLVIDFFSEEDLQAIVKLMKENEDAEMEDMMEEYIASMEDAGDEQGEGSDSEQTEQPDDDPADESVNEETTVDTTDEPKEEPQASKETTTDESRKSDMDPDTDDDNLAETLGTLINEARNDQADTKGSQQNDEADTGKDTDDTPEADNYTTENKSDSTSNRKETSVQTDDEKIKQFAESLAGTRTGEANESALSDNTSGAKGGPNTSDTNETTEVGNNSSSATESADPQENQTTDETTSEGSKNADEKKTKEDNQTATTTEESEVSSAGEAESNKSTADKNGTTQQQTAQAESETSKDESESKVSSESSESDTEMTDDADQAEDDDEDMYSVSNFSV